MKWGKVLGCSTIVTFVMVMIVWRPVVALLTRTDYCRNRQWRLAKTLHAPPDTWKCYSMWCSTNIRGEKTWYVKRNWLRIDLNGKTLTTLKGTLDDTLTGLWAVNSGLLGLVDLDLVGYGSERIGLILVKRDGEVGVCADLTEILKHGWLLDDVASDGNEIRIVMTGLGQTRTGTINLGSCQPASRLFTLWGCLRRNLYVIGFRTQNPVTRVFSKAQKLKPEDLMKMEMVNGARSGD